MRALHRHGESISIYVRGHLGRPAAALFTRRVAIREARLPARVIRLRYCACASARSPTRIGDRYESAQISRACDVFCVTEREREGERESSGRIGAHWSSYTMRAAQVSSIFGRWGDCWRSWLLLGFLMGWFVVLNYGTTRMNVESYFACLY